MRTCVRLCCFFLPFLFSVRVFSQVPYAYVVNGSSNNVSVINVSTGAVTATIPVMSAPRAVTMSPNGSTVYVAHLNIYTVSAISTATNTVTGTITVSGGPSAMAVSPNGSALYVVNSSANNVSVINTATNTVTTTISVGTSPFGVAVSPDGSKIYVTNYTPASVSVIDAATNTVTATVAVGLQPNVVLLSPDGSKAYVSNFNGGTVSVINTAANTVVATITVGTNPQGMAISPDGSKLYVGNWSSGTVSVIATSTNAVTKTITGFSEPRGLSITPDGTKLYVANAASGSVAVVNTSNNTIASTIAVGSRPFSLGNFIGIVNNTLPVRFLSIAATQKVPGLVDLNWSAAENEVSHYEVEESNDGSAFFRKGEVSASHSASYHWSLPSPVSGIGYYRIKAVDKTGSAAYSPIVKCTPFGNAAALSLSPNPLYQQNLSLHFENKPAGSYSVTLSNSAGQIVLLTTVAHAGGTSTQVLDLPALAPGVYQMTVMLGKDVKTLPLVIN